MRPFTTMESQKMQDLRKHLEKHFHFMGGRDNMPILAEPMSRKEEWVTKWDVADPANFITHSSSMRNGGRLQLAKTMSDMGLKTAVEVACRYGQIDYKSQADESAKLWLDNIADLYLTCIDPYVAYHRVSQERQDLIYAEAQKNAAKFGFNLMRIASLDAVDGYDDGELDWVCIDGNHCFDAAVQDIIRWAPKVRVGGLVLVHDYCEFALSGVIPAIDSYTQCHWIDPWYVTRDKEPTAFWQRGEERA